MAGTERTFTPPAWAAAALALALAACGPAAGSAPALRTRLLEGSAGALRAELWARPPVTSGLRRLSYRLFREGRPVAAARVRQRLAAEGAPAELGCPAVDPAGPTDEGDFPAAVVFPPTAAPTRWSLTLEVTLEGDTVPLTVPLGTLQVEPSDAARVLEADGERLLLGVGFDAPPAVGRNDYQVSLHAVGPSGSAFTPVEDATFRATVQMPSMGHGSSGNTDPVHRGLGLYQGAASFPMAGEWLLGLEPSRAGQRLGGIDLRVEVGAASGR